MKRVVNSCVSLLLSAALVWGVLSFGGNSLWAAGVKPLEDLSGTLVERQIVELADSNATAAANLQQGMEKVFAGMELSSPEKMADAAQLVVQARQSLVEAGKAAAELSGYVAANRGRLVGKQSRFLPLAKLNEQLEAPYLDSVDLFLTAAHELLAHAGPNFGKICVGSQPERQRYEELYQAYSRAVANLNDQGAARTKRLNDWLKRYEELRDLLPR